MCKCHKTSNIKYASWYCSNYIILKLIPGFTGLDKENCKKRQQTLGFGDLGFGDLGFGDLGFGAFYIRDLMACFSIWDKMYIYIIWNLA